MVTTPVLTPTTRNVMRVFRSATPEHVQAGIAWYAEANRIAGELSAQYGISLATASGVIAALSPLNSWGANVRLAQRLVAAGGLTSGYLGVGLRAANAILGGADPDVILKGNKVRAFYYGILTAGATDVTTIDRHAWSLAVNHRYPEGNIPGLTGKRYAAAVNVYVRAARIASRELGYTVSAAQIQAITWLAWRARYWAAGAWDLAA